MIHNFNTRRNNWPEQSLAKVYFQQCFQSWSEAKQIEKYPPQGYCEVFRTTCLRKEVGIQWRVSEKPRQSWPSPAWNYLSVEMAPWQELLCGVALAALPKTGLEVKLWQFSPCTVLTKPWIRRRDETKVQDSTVASAASGSCCCAAPGGLRWNSFHCFGCARRQAWEGNEGAETTWGGTNLGHHFCVWTGDWALGRDLRVGKCYRYSPTDGAALTAVSWKHLDSIGSSTYGRLILSRGHWAKLSEKLLL